MYRMVMIATATILAMSSGLVNAEEKHTIQAGNATDSRTLVPAELGSTRNVHAFGDTLLGGQPTAEELALARDRGIKTVITLREPSEIDWDQSAIVRSLGLDFHGLGFRAPDSLTNELIDRVLAVMSDPASGPVMLHCASANRVGAIWMAHRVLNDEVDLDQARKEAKQIGLRSPEYESKVVAYIRQRRDEN